MFGEIRYFCGRATPSVVNYSILLFEGALFDLIEQVCLPGECIRIKRNAFESVLMRWMKLKPIIQKEVSEKERQISYINAYIWNLGRWY